MKKVLLLLPILVGLIALSYVGYQFGFFERFRKSSTGEGSSGVIDIPGGYPDEMVSYDVSAAQAVFIIENVDKESGSMLLRYIFPVDRQGDLVNSKIECPLSDSWIIKVDANDELVSRTPAKEPLYRIADSTQDTLQGICTDASCLVISSMCELIVPNE